MANALGLFTAWLADFYVLATVLLVAEALAAVLAGRPARRMALARPTLLGLAVLALVLALPGRARLALGLLAGETGRPLAAPWLAGLFLTGMALVSVWLLVGATRAWLLRRRSRPAPTHLQETLQQVLGADGPVPALRLGTDLAQPVAVGAWRPLVLLPAHLEHEAAGEQLEAVLAHEGAHVAHGDLRLLALSRLLLLVLFAHPLYWLLRRRLRADQELLADAAVAARAGAVDYAATLVDLARGRRGLDSTRSAAPAMAAPAGGSPLRQRIAALLHPDFSAEDRWAPRWYAAAALLTVVAVIGLSPVTLRQINGPSPAIYASSSAAAPAPQIALPPPLVKIDVVVVQLPVAPPDAPQPVQPEAMKARRAFFDVSMVFGWWNQARNQWFYRMMMWWYAERVRRM